MSSPGPRLATCALAVAAQVAFAACGSSGSTPAQDAAVFADVGADGPSCAALPCLAGATALVAACAPSGTCIEQVTVSGGGSTMAKCFSNGVKIVLAGTRLASGGTSSVMTVRKDGAACYSFTATSDDASASAGSAVYADGAGATLVTEMVSGADLTVSCPGGSAIVSDSSCDAALYALQGLYPFTNTNCTSGACAF